MMKKTYINPTIEVVELKTKCSILAGSGQGGVTNNSTPGDEYNDQDVSY